MLAFTIAAIMPSLLTLAAENRPAKAFFSKPILMGAHRGGSELWPENTLEAFRNAAARWPDAVIETDTHITSDNQVVLVHDDRVDRTTNGHGAIGDLTLAEVRQLDAAYHFTQDGGKSFPYRGKGIGIPTLAEALAALPDTRFLIELKNQTGVAEATMKVLREAHALDRIALASFNPVLLAQAHQLEPAAAHCYDMLEGVTLLGYLRGENWANYQPVADILAVPEDLIKKFNVQPAELRAIRDKGVAVLVEPINNPEDMQAYLSIGVSCILTDRPNVLAEVMAEMKK